MNFRPITILFRHLASVSVFILAVEIGQAANWPGGKIQNLLIPVQGPCQEIATAIYWDEAEWRHVDSKGPVLTKNLS
jgi:hypothetical protein